MSNLLDKNLAFLERLYAESKRGRVSNRGAGESSHQTSENHLDHQLAIFGRDVGSLEALSRKGETKK